MYDTSLNVRKYTVFNSISWNSQPNKWLFLQCMDGLEQHGVISSTLGLFLETKRRDPSSFHGLQLDCYFMGVGGGIYSHLVWNNG